jgi:hypothetical protein
LPRPPLSRRDIPLDPIIDLGLDPLIEPWADDVPVRLRCDELSIDDAPFAAGGGDFGGGGASGDWDGDSSDESSGSDD